MAKPIFIIAVPQRDADEIPFIMQNLKDTMSDYHHIVYPHSKDEPEFKVFYEKDFDEVKYEELKQIVIDRLK